MKKRRLFLAAYAFPPRISSGTFRPVKFVKYLPDFFDGEIHVITSSSEDCSGDADLEKDIEGRCTVHRVIAKFDPGRWKEEQVSKIQHSRGLRKGLQTCLLLAVKLFNGAYHAVKEIFVFPDGKLFWSMDAVKYVEESLKPVPGDIFLTTCPERSLLLAGAKIKKKLPFLKWIVDFRDGWYGKPFNFHTRNPIRIFGEKWMERRVFDYADEVVCTSELIEEVYRTRYSSHARKLCTIYNGFDPGDFENIEPHRLEKDCFNIVYTGYAGGKRTTYVLLEAVQRMKSIAPAEFETVIVNFVGRFKDDKERWKQVLGDHVRFHGPVSHREAIEFMLGADLLLLLTNEKEGGLTTYAGKVFEYIRARVPILALSPPGGAARLIEKWNLGWFVSDKDPVAISDRLIKIISDWKGGASLEMATDELLKKFDRRETAKALADLLVPEYNSNSAQVGADLR